MNKFLLSALLALPFFLPQDVAAQTQDLQALHKIGEDFLRSQNADQPGIVNVFLGKIDSRQRLSACSDPTAFIPQGGKIIGRTTLGFRCNAPKQWTIYVPANVQLIGDYFVTTTVLAQGQTISSKDIKKVNGDLSTLPAGALTSEDQIVGRSAQSGLSIGTVLKLANLKNLLAIQQGQSVKIIALGSNFKVSTDGLALNNASEGQIVKAKTGSGQLISGIAKLGGFIEVQY
jgi:flagella basal body P-ring formation protein FlgA